MQSKLEKIDAKVFQELTELQSESLVGGIMEGPTGTAEYTWTPSGSDGKVDVDWN